MSLNPPLNQAANCLNVFDDGQEPEAVRLFSSNSFPGLNDPSIIPPDRGRLHPFDTQQIVRARTKTWASSTAAGQAPRR
jgi:hypothetical protein